MREETLKLEKVKKSCKITGTVSLILELLLIVAIVACIASAIICFSLHTEIDQAFILYTSQEEAAEFNSIVESFDGLSTSGFLKFTVHMDQLVQDGQYGKICGILCLFGTVICAMTAFLFDVIRRMFKKIHTSETPFTPEILKGFKIMSIIICVELLLMSGIGSALLGGLIFWSIYNIFDYGFVIQQQVDETL